METATRMNQQNQQALMFHVVVTNNDNAPRTFELKIKLTAATSTHSYWGWRIPRDKNAVAKFSATVGDQGRSLRLCDPSNQLANCFFFERKPDELLAQEHSGQAVWHVTLKPTASWTINYALAVGEREGAVRYLAMILNSQFDAIFAQVQNDWQNQFNAMFTPKNSYFSGNLPVLVTSDEQ